MSLSLWYILTADLKAVSPLITSFTSDEQNVLTRVMFSQRESKLQMSQGCFFNPLSNPKSAKCC